MPEALPALNLIAAPGQRRATLDTAREIERRGFAEIQVSSSFGNMSQCLGLAFATERIPFATAIAPIYAQTADEFAQNAAYLHEVSGGRFRFGVGIAHGPSHARMGVTPGKPLGDTRDFVARLRAYDGQVGGLPPIILATLRRRMIALAGEIADGMIFANGARSHMAQSLAALPADKRNDQNFYIGNRIRTCINDDIAEAKAVLLRTVGNYVLMPNYRNYWKEAGYADEMNAIEAALAAGRQDEVPRYLTDRWLADITLYGPAAKVREGVETWHDAGITSPCLVPLSADGDQVTALKTVFDAFED
jgi:alkanesulfonate monooxygenase SsuD/methylene tetrahydromethanopterin reductase-like flavin-dependent oxidoreductase (luciferase family)